VFVVGCFGNWRSPAEVLFEPESLCGDITPSREKGQEIAKSVAKCLTKRGAGDENHDPETANFITYSIAGNIIDRQPENGGNGTGYSKDVSYTLTKMDRHAVQKNKIIRRLTPLECERLQGFPDNYTNIPNSKDGSRYAALGNSMAVPVMRWIGERINKLEGINYD
jgi:DNA (cytosine-5)-methyltransferase 1